MTTNNKHYKITNVATGESFVASCEPIQGDVDPTQQYAAQAEAELAAEGIVVSATGPVQRSVPPGYETQIKEPLRLEAGHYYKNRRGEVVGPLKDHIGDSPEWAFSDGTHSYRANGTWNLSKTIESAHDLVTEHIAPQSYKPKWQTHYSDQPDVEIKLGDWANLRGRDFDAREIVEIDRENGWARVDPPFPEGIEAEGRWAIGLFNFVRRADAPQSEEDRAKAEIKTGWLWFGFGPIAGCDLVKGGDPDVARWGLGWQEGACGNSPTDLYALRAGSEIARKNGLEPVAAIPATPAFPAVGTRLVFTEDDVESGAEEGDEIVVRDVGKCGFECSNGIVYGPNWRDGLEPLPTPPVRPDGDLREVYEALKKYFGE